MPLTDQEAWLLADAIAENKDLYPIFNNLMDTDIKNKADILTAIISDININNPESSAYKIKLLNDLKNLAEEIAKESKRLNDLYSNNEIDRLQEEKSLSKLFEQLQVEKVVETDFSITTGFDSEINSNRLELTTAERRSRKELIILEIEKNIINIENTIITYTPNRLLDLNERKIKIYTYLNNTKIKLENIKKYDMVNIILRSSNIIPSAQEEIQKIINFYNDWDVYNIDLWRKLKEIHTELNNLLFLMQKIEYELSL
ncbi:MAG: hypothetical protein H7836_13700 [Magnetococcus sp. YQC-3]